MSSRNGNGNAKDAKARSPSLPIPRPAKIAKHAWSGTLPADDAAEDASTTMKHIITDVQAELHGALVLAAGQANAHVVAAQLHQVQPLQIKEKLKDGEVSSFKAPWTKQQCLQSIKTTGLYEAACNILWLTTGIDQQLPFELPTSRPSWALVHEISERTFGEEGGLGGLTPGAASRLYFPVVIPACVLDDSVLQKDCFQDELSIVGGHGLVLGWYLAVWKAIRRQKKLEWLMRLWECGLTVSVRVRKATAADLRPVLLDSWSFSESVQVANMAGSDSFSIFAAKLAMFVRLHKDSTGGKCKQDAVVKHLVSQGVRYKGAIINVSMYKMATTVNAALDDAARKQLELLEWKYGPELLSASYNKLGRLVQAAQKVASAIPDAAHDECILFALQMLDFSCLARLVKSAKFFTMDVVERQKDGSQGWFGLTMNKLKFLKFVLSSLVSSVSKANDALHKSIVEDVVPLFPDPPTVFKTFGEALEDTGVTTLSPVCKQFRDLLLSTFKGEFDPAFKSMALETPMRNFLSASGDDDKGPLQSLCQAVSALQRAAATLSVVSSAPACGGTNSRRLVREDSDEQAEEKLRQSLQQRASVERKKYVQFVTSGSFSKQSLDKAWAESAVRTMDVGKENPRVFTFSADLIAEHAKEPWIRPCTLSDSLLDGVCDFLKEQKGGFDWLMLFDGRNRDTFRHMTKCLQGRPHGNELMILYKPTAVRTEAGRTRKVAMGASNIETVLLWTPVPKTLLAAKERNNYNSLGEASTHDTTYSGVPFRSFRSLPRITEADKRSIMGTSSPAGLPDQLKKSFPNPVLFWQESKPVELYEQFLVDFDFKAIFDLSPGSGGLAEAALRKGCAYVGVTTSTEHAKWLNNVLDRVALTQMATAGTACHAKDLSADIRLHFPEFFLLTDERITDDDEDGAMLSQLAEGTAQ